MYTILNKTIAILLIGLAFAVTFLVFRVPNAGAVPAPCALCTCKDAYVLSVNGAQPKWYFKDLGNGNWQLTTHAFSDVNTLRVCDNGTPQELANQNVAAVGWNATRTCAYVPPPIDYKLEHNENSEPPAPDPAPGAGTIVRLSCTP